MRWPSGWRAKSEGDDFFDSVERVSGLPDPATDGFRPCCEHAQSEIESIRGGAYRSRTGRGRWQLGGSMNY